MTEDLLKPDVMSEGAHGMRRRDKICDIQE